MATTINNIKVDFGLGATPPRVTFLQGADMDVSTIRDSIRQIEESEEGRGAPGAVSAQGTAFGWIARAGGNFAFSDVESTALSVEILPPYEMFFEAGAIPFQTSLGNLLGTFIDSPGAIVQINNAVGASNVNQDALNFAVYAGAVTVQSGSGITGTVFPVGIEQFPVDNLADAKTILSNIGLSTINVLGNWTFGATDDLDGLKIVGQGPGLTKLTFTSGCSTAKTILNNASITGDMDGAIDATDCHFENTTGIGGTGTETNLNNCLFVYNGVDPAITISASANDDIHMVDCVSGNPSNQPVDIDFNGSGPGTTIRRYAGGMRLLNITNGQELSFDTTGGHVTVDSTCTSMNLTVRGATKITDNRATKTPAITDQTTTALNWAYSAALTVQKWIGLR